MKPVSWSKTIRTKCNYGISDSEKPLAEKALTSPYSQSVMKVFCTIETQLVDLFAKQFIQIHKQYLEISEKCSTAQVVGDTGYTMLQEILNVLCSMNKEYQTALGYEYHKLAYPNPNAVDIGIVKARIAHIKGITMYMNVMIEHFENEGIYWDLYGESVEHSHEEGAIDYQYSEKGPVAIGINGLPEEEDKVINPLWKKVMTLKIAENNRESTDQVPL